MSIIFQSDTAQKLDKINFIIGDLRKKEAEVTQTLQTTNGKIKNFKINNLFFVVFLQNKSID